MKNPFVRSLQLIATTRNQWEMEPLWNWADGATEAVWKDRTD